MGEKKQTLRVSLTWFYLQGLNGCEFKTREKV
jgi:hypothetical protein